MVINKKSRNTEKLMKNTATKLNKYKEEIKISLMLMLAFLLYAYINSILFLNNAALAKNPSRKKSIPTTNDTGSKITDEINSEEWLNKNGGIKIADSNPPIKPAVLYSK